MSTRPALVNRQFNTPIKLYSPDTVADIMNEQSHILVNGTVGIDFHKMAAPGNLANSAVLRMLEEAEKGEKENKFFEHSKTKRRVQRFEWPPKGPDNNNDNNDDVNDLNNNLDNKMADRNSCANPRPRRFTSTIPILTSPGLKRVAWPPPPENLRGDLIQDSVYPKEPVFYAPVSTSPGQQRDDQSWSPSSPPSQQPASEPVFQRTIQVAAPAFEPPPSLVTLRRTAPVSQAPPPVFESQPAAIRARGPRMRGDEKWPPAENKAQAAAENEARKALAKGPACRPRAPKKDYSKFFAQHQLTNNYPGYRAPPGTQHYIEEGTSNF